MISNLLSSINRIFDRILNNESDKRIDDLIKFEDFIKKVSPHAVSEIYTSLYGSILRDSHLHVFDEIDEFYSTPYSEFYSLGLENKSKTFRDATNKLMDFTQNNFMSYGHPDMLKIPKPKDIDSWFATDKLHEDLRNLVTNFTKAYNDFYQQGKKKSLSRVEVLTMVGFFIFVPIVLYIISL